MYQPLNDIVLIDPEPPQDYAQQTGTKLVLPDAYRWGHTEPPRKGRIAAKGPLCTITDLPIGSRVVYARYGWEKLMDSDGKEWHLVKEMHILAVECA